MKIEADSVLPYSRELVFRTYRDEINDFVEFLPNVSQIEVKERSDEGELVRMLNIWHGGGEIPAPLRKLVDGTALSWDDYALWNQSEWSCKWDIKTHAFREAVTCGGLNQFVELGEGRTRLEIRGELSLDLKKVRGVPSFLAGSLGRTIEAFLTRQITANLTTVSDALIRYLESKHG